jgi:two-component system chemotaxis family response regulator WspR
MQMALMAKRLQDTSAPEQTSVVDSLTGLYKQLYLVERLDEEIIRACRDKHEVAVVLVEVRFPESLNTYARMVKQDEVIRKAAETIKASVRKVDVAGRYTDNVFAIILPHTGQQADIVKGRLEQRLAAIQVDSGTKGIKMNLEISAGFTTYPADGSNAATLLESALKIAGIESGESNELPEAA